MEREIICVVCPSSCRVTVKAKDGEVTGVSGYSCRRGRDYAVHEFAAPVRTLTTTMQAEGYVSPIISVRSSRPMPKEKQAACMEVIRKEIVKPPFDMNRVVIENILETGVDIVLTNC